MDIHNMTRSDLINLVVVLSEHSPENKKIVDNCLLSIQEAEKDKELHTKEALTVLAAGTWATAKVLGKGLFRVGTKLTKGTLAGSKAAIAEVIKA